MKYKISINQLGKDQHSKVYSLQEKNSEKEFIVKIYEDSRITYYNNETNILIALNKINLNKENIFFHIFKDMKYNSNMFQIPKEVRGFNLEFLFYDYLSKLSLIDYIDKVNEQIKEIHVQYLCYILLKAIEKMRSINICHNKIDISNIMFDDDFNPKLIHFSEAKIIDDKSEFNKDLFYLGKILAKIISSGKFSSINYSKKSKVFIINGFSQGKNIQIEEKKFWKLLKDTYNLNISEKFQNFFHILIKAKKSNELIDINDLLKNEWLNDINKDIKLFENNFKKEFNELYRAIIEDNEKNNSINIDIKNILDEDINEIINDDLLKYAENLKKERQRIEKDKKMPNLNLTNYNYYNIPLNLDVNKKMFNNNFGLYFPVKYPSGDLHLYQKERSPEGSYSYKFSFENKINDINENKITIGSVSPSLLIDEENDLNENEQLKNKIFETSKPKKIEKIEKPKIKKTINIKRKASLRQKKRKREFIYQNNLKKVEKINQKKENFMGIEKENLEKKYQNIGKNLDLKNSESDKNLNYYFMNYKLSPLDQKQNKFFFDIKSIIEESNSFKPRNDDFNYLQINIKNDENKDIKKAVINLMKNLKAKIKEKYNKTEIKVDFKNEKDFSLEICYQIPPIIMDYDKIQFLDDKFENKVKNIQKFEIKVDLIEGDKSSYSLNKINQYYLLFNGVSVDREDFYEHLKILKDISIDLLLNN